MLCANYNLNNEVSCICHLSVKTLTCISSTYETFCLLKMTINPFIHHSVPLVTDLLETSVDEVLRVSVPMVTPEDLGPIGASSSTVAEETLSLTGELNYANIEHLLIPAHVYVLTFHFLVMLTVCALFYRGCSSTQATGD